MAEAPPPPSSAIRRLVESAVASDRRIAAALVRVQGTDADEIVEMLLNNCRTEPDFATRLHTT